ncbi:hypothetical protein PVAND_014128 [Polypedilum vanderplanki]|uniref:CCHC-type domain-containing protein n=1 Tax=Polypedilum vanderplanki TaxID=319348 RepID=A0A9J6CSJ4_POLVA|nr:hypothetical protein PVAND_014128 [Polypedilum vanderplanki]
MVRKRKISPRNSPNKSRKNNAGKKMKTIPQIKNDQSNQRNGSSPGPSKRGITTISSAGSSSSICSMESFNSKKNEATSKKVKPIFVDCPLVPVRNVINNVNLKSKPMLKLSNGKTQIQCNNLDDKQKVIEKLKSQSIRFYTFTENINKPQIVLLKGYYWENNVQENIQLDNLKKNLTDQGLVINLIKVFYKNDDYVIFSVSFKEKINLIDLNFNYKIIDSIIVRWEPLKSSNKKPMQCFNCQRFGHSAMNCGYQNKCVKCTEDHKPGECARIKNEEGKPKCVNCGGDHPANFSKCPENIKYQEKINELKKKSDKRKIRNPAQTRLHKIQHSYNDKDFPELPSPSTTNKHLGHQVSLDHHMNRNDALINKFNDACKRFKEIPNIQRSIEIFVNFVENLEAASTEAERQLILRNHIFANNYDT